MTLLSLVLFLVLLLASIADVRQRRVPNWLTYGGLGFAVLFAIQSDEMVFCEAMMGSIKWRAPLVVEQSNLIELPQTDGQYESNSLYFGKHSVRAATGCLGLTIPLLLLYASGGIGGGDVKLGACIGAFTGIETGISILFLGHVLAGLFALLCIARSRQSTTTSRGIPMAIFYSLGTLLITIGPWI